MFFYSWIHSVFGRLEKYPYNIQDLCMCEWSFFKPIVSLLWAVVCVACGSVDSVRFEALCWAWWRGEQKETWTKRRWKKVGPRLGSVVEKGSYFTFFSIRFVRAGESVFLRTMSIVVFFSCGQDIPAPAAQHTIASRINLYSSPY